VDFVRIIEDLGLFTGIIIFSGYLLLWLVKYILKDISEDMKTNHIVLYDIVVKLIDSNNKCRDEVKGIQSEIKTITRFIRDA